MKQRLNLKLIAPALAASLALIMLTCLVLMAAFAQPVADQYHFMSSVRDQGIIGYTVSMYTTWSGRLVQTLGIGLAYRLFGDFGAQVFMPLVFLTFLTAAYAWAVSLIFKFKEHKLLLSAFFGLLLAGGTLYTTSCLFDIYLWLDAEIVYLLGIIMIIFDFSFFLWLCQNWQKLKKSRRHELLLAIFILIAILGQTAGETSMVFTLGWSVLALAGTCLIKKFRKYRLPAVVIFTTLLTGSLIMILSPGLWARAGSGETDYFKVLISAPAYAYLKILREITPMKVALAVLSGLTLSVFVKPTLKRPHILTSLLAAFLIALSTTYISFVLYFLGSGPGGLESRIFAVPDMGVFLAAVLLLAIFFAYLRQNVKSFPVVFVTVAILAALFGARDFFSFNKGYLVALTTRANLMSARVAEINQYQSSGASGELTLPDAPVMIENSSATDFTLNGWLTVDWFYDSFTSYYHLPETTTVHGERLIEGEAPAWYLETGRNTCTPPAKVIFNKYYCETIIEEN